MGSHDLVLVVSDDLEVLDVSEQAELARLTADEDERQCLPLRHGPVVGVAILRRRIHGNRTGMLEAVELPASGLVVAGDDGSASWGAHGLEGLDDRRLEAFSRKTLELMRAVTREQLRRESRHA